MAMQTSTAAARQNAMHSGRSPQHIQRSFHWVFMCLCLGRLLRRQPSREGPSCALALAATHAALEPMAAAQAGADAAPGRAASVEWAAADVSPPLREQRQLSMTVTGYRTLAAAEAVAPACAAFLEGAQQAVDPVANAFAAAIVRHVIPALTAHLQAALAAIPRQQPPHQACSHSPHSQQQQRQTSGGSIHGSWGSGGQHLDASSSATLRLGNFETGVLGGGGHHGDDLPGACQAIVLSGCKSAGFSLCLCFCHTSCLSFCT
jgi:hypothetical protein